ncbi:fructose-2,6-bisphosphatase [Chytriomyces cf. hyalinus JEL632]|nr:fructose-2,6-bisphosphatase [Chytriomyces cf. hyalinus JEL632]
MRFFLVRHGQSNANVQDRICSLPENGTLPGEGLSPEGKAQVSRSSTNVLLSAGLKSDTRIAIISSDFTRALETAQILQQTILSNDYINVSLRVDARLRERNFGTELEGKSGATEYERVWAADVRRIEFAGVESPESVLARSLAVVAEMKDVSADCDVVFLVAHGDTLQILQSKDVRRGAEVSCWDHRSLVHLETAEIREVAFHTEIQ